MQDQQSRRHPCPTNKGMLCSSCGSHAAGRCSGRPLTVLELALGRRSPILANRHGHQQRKCKPQGPHALVDARFAGACARRSLQSFHHAKHGHEPLRLGTGLGYC